MTALAWACVYLLGAIITYGACWNLLNTSKIEAELKAEHPRISPPAHSLAVIATSATLAAIWPATAAIALADLIPTRPRLRKAHALDVGQTITIDGHPMVITSISHREHPGIGRTASITCASTDHTEGDPQ